MDSMKRRPDEPDLVAARYEAATDEVVLVVATGVMLRVPRRLIPGFEAAQPEQLSHCRIIGGAETYWEGLDDGFSMQELVDHLYGTRYFLARMAGCARSPAKARSARESGKRGGRPRKAATAIVAA